MSKFTYPLFIWKNHRGLVIFSLIFITAMQFLIIRLITTFDTVSIVSAIMDQLPPQIRMFLTQEFLTVLSVEGAAAFGFNHPLVLTVLAINAIILPTRDLAGEIENGTMELLLSYPLRRTTLLFSLWISGSVLFLAIIGGGFVGSITAISIFYQLNFHFFLKLLQIVFNLWLLFVLIFSFTLLLATFGREGSKTGARAAAITLVFYLLHFLSAIWETLKFTRPFNIFTYYQPAKLMFELESVWVNVFVLTVLTGICLTASLRQFNRRDIPG
jgi:ABC-type transport system involved in multi-copper enzyme maturation permease subunit